ncbi:hypothetical protein [Amycolatopsis pithecellobii]|uniref:Uncharacterized protein n=1 Tax=Amycolatopsis pithecellobii TaxID=664692 RepID=A0A6N7Z2K6_9PSEU|nr:hypothetical protein [Amycolatopsis pithecellobii]MTD54064.1 hypothetical protein [Amycolatopsis pithecellobii]
MYVKVARTPARPEPSVEENDDCTRLHVVTEGLDEAAVGAVLAGGGLGRPGTPGQVWLDVAALRARSRGAARDWPERFAAMIAYARRCGWLSPDGGLAAAHIAANSE